MYFLKLHKQYLAAKPKENWNVLFNLEPEEMMENLLSCLNVRKLDIVMEILRQAQKSLSYFRQEILSETENGI